MIIQSPESPMPEPYKTYVDERAASIAETLTLIVGEQTNVQLCPRAILPEEVYFTDPSAIVYGSVVNHLKDGEKSVLYAKDASTSTDGVVAHCPHAGLAYAKRILDSGNRIRFKDPRESDGRGQSILSSAAEAETALFNFSALHESGAVLMPHIATVKDRFSIGQIRLGELGVFSYIGREFITARDGQDSYGGADLAVIQGNTINSLEHAALKLDIPTSAIGAAKDALHRFKRVVRHAGRASVDILCGEMDNGAVLNAVVDITPRVGNNTPPELEAIKALLSEDATTPHIAYSSARLHYNPQSASIDPNATRYIDTETLVATASVSELEKIPLNV